MAEWGSPTQLLAEVQDAINAGQAETAIAGPGMGDSPGTVSTLVQLTPDYPLVTLVSMVAPSPDWFIGVGNLDLRPGGIWVSELVVDLYAYDAGTDSGPSYTSPDQPTVPPEPIAPIIGNPFTEGVSLGTFTFTLETVSDVPDASVFTATAFPNPFNPQTTIAWKVACGEHPAGGNPRYSGKIDSPPPGRNDGGRTRPGFLENGQDDSGNQAGSGLYFARVITEIGSVTRKLTLVQ